MSETQKLTQAGGAAIDRDGERFNSRDLIDARVRRAPAIAALAIAKRQASANTTSTPNAGATTTSSSPPAASGGSTPPAGNGGTPGVDNGGTGTATSKSDTSGTKPASSPVDNDTQQAQQTAKDWEVSLDHVCPGYLKALPSVDGRPTICIQSGGNPGAGDCQRSCSLVYNTGNSNNRAWLRCCWPLSDSLACQGPMAAAVNLCGSCSVNYAAFTYSTGDFSSYLTQLDRWCSQTPRCSPIVSGSSAGSGCSNAVAVSNGQSSSGAGAASGSSGSGSGGSGSGGSGSGGSGSGGSASGGSGGSGSVGSNGGGASSSVKRSQR